MDREGLETLTSQDLQEELDGGGRDGVEIRRRAVLLHLGGFNGPSSSASSRDAGRRLRRLAWRDVVPRDEEEEIAGRRRQSIVAALDGEEGISEAAALDGQEGIVRGGGGDRVGGEKVTHPLPGEVGGIDRLLAWTRLRREPITVCTYQTRAMSSVYAVNR